MALNIIWIFVIFHGYVVTNNLSLCLQGERDGSLHFVDSSRAPTPASRYGAGYYSIYHNHPYSGSITPLSCHSHSLDVIHLEMLREKLVRLTRDKGFFVDPCVFDKQ